MKNKINLLTFLALLFSTSSAFSIEISKHISTIIDPEPLVRVHPKYPIKAARESRSGWTKFSFIIEKDGSVSNILELDSSGSEDFSKEAVKALKKWQYQPAMENGQPIQQCVNTVQLDFKMGQDKSGGVRRRFKKTYNSAMEALNEQKFEKVEELITKLASYKYRHATENNYLHLISAEYYEVLGEKQKQLTSLNKVRFSYDNLVPDSHMLSVLNKQFLLSVQLNKFQSAYSTFKRIKKLDIAKANIENYDSVITQIDEFIGGEQDIVVAADINDQDFWHYPLVRNEFSLVDINGSLNKLDVRCANKRHVYTVEANNTWSIPKSWKNCSVLVYGDDNTHFKLVEHPLKS
ncbi:MAG: energy transducer TonB [Thalassotalea sp.]|nr:energy transducer TonB [Thalassotalea sp.]